MEYPLLEVQQRDLPVQIPRRVVAQLVGSHSAMLGESERRPNQVLQASDVRLSTLTAQR
jgi:hypothetical protein